MCYHLLDHPCSQISQLSIPAVVDSCLALEFQVPDFLVGIELPEAEGLGKHFERPVVEMPGAFLEGLGLGILLADLAHLDTLG